MNKELQNIPAVLAVLWRMHRRNPTFMSFNVSNRCNEQCLMCSVWRTPSEELSLVEMERIFLDVRRFGIRVLEISGGEPFLRKDIFEILKLVDRIGFLFTVSSNGTLLDPAFVERLNGFRRMLQLAVSVDSLERDVFRKLRGVDALPRVLGNLEALVEKKPSFPVKINFTMNRFNYRETMTLLDYAEKLGIFLSVFPVNQGPGFLHRSSENDFLPRQEERREMASLFRHLAGLRKQGAPLWDFSRFYERAAAYVLSDPVGPCDAGSLYLDLHADGILAPCVDQEGIGDLRREGISEAYKRIEAQRARLAACAKSSPCCYTCTYHVSVTASNLAAYGRERLTTGVRRLLRKKPAQRNSRFEVSGTAREDNAWNTRTRLP